MNWTRFLLAVIASGVAAMFTDWLFMGVLFHKKYLETPEVWRLEPGASESSSIAASTVLGMLSCAALIYLSIWAGALHAVSGALRLAVLAWLAAPLPVILTNAIWIKLHPLVGVSHAIGWLVRFTVTALIATWLLR